MVQGQAPGRGGAQASIRFRILFTTKIIVFLFAHPTTSSERKRQAGTIEFTTELDAHFSSLSRRGALDLMLLFISLTLLGSRLIGERSELGIGYFY